MRAIKEEKSGIYIMKANNFLLFSPSIKKRGQFFRSAFMFFKNLNCSDLHSLNCSDLGDTYNFRYPLDQYDRIWKPDSHADPLAKQTSSFVANLSNKAPELTVPPIQVLQTALSHPERLVLLYENLDPGYYKYDLFLYFLELNDSVQAGQRVFDVYLNDEKRVQVDIVLEGSRSYAAVLNITANGHLNLTMVKASNGSQLGPMINAYEILQVYPILVQDTVQEEGKNAKS